MKMPNFLDKTVIPVGVNDKHKFPLHRGHISTSTFMRFDIAMARELAGNSSYKGNHQTFIRTMPFKKPLLSSLHVHNNAFFVPFRTVWEPFSDFITDTPHNQPAGTSIISNTPLLLNSEVVGTFQDPKYSTIVVSPGSNNAYDYYDGNSAKYRKLTTFGRWAYSLLVQLGYRFNFTLSKDDDYSRSCLPLLCAAKVYLDFYYPNAYAHYGVYAVLDGIMQRQVTYYLTSTELDMIFDALYKVSYNSDYFVSAFDNPSGPNNGVGSFNFNLVDLTNDLNASNVVNNNAETNGNANGTPAIELTDGNLLTQYNLMTLHRLNDYVQRHQLAGSRALERYLADFGVALTADKLKRCIHLKSSEFPFQVGEVMSDADTYQVSAGGDSTGAQLGDYAGRAVAYDGNLNFEFETDEFGYLFVVSTIVPDVGYCQGEDRFVMHQTKLDFLSSFDGCGPQAITQNELFVGLKRQSNMDALFGFTSRYAEYATTKDVLSGDFLFDSVNLGLRGWETMRLWSDYFADAQFNVAHSLDFMLGKDSLQYNRIFINDDDDYNSFILVHRDNFELVQPKLPLFDMFDWEDEKKKRITLQANGTKVN